jgi:hypothetical protein
MTTTTPTERTVMTDDTLTLPTRVEGFICLSAELRWGWGSTPEEAVKVARKMNGGRGARKGERLIYALPAGALDAYVDGMGGINWTWADDAPDRTVKGHNVEEPRG